ncbi:DUF6207 family protein [Streptomyces althioticus]|uniref:DUF6207 family protein n=1 Tax=Streptomyces althioticus TaxID=83380 RepID=UPI0033BF681A
MDPIREAHLSEPGLLIIDVAGRDDATVFALQGRDRPPVGHLDRRLSCPCARTQAAKSGLGCRSCVVARGAEAGRPQGGGGRSGWPMGSIGGGALFSGFDTPPGGIKARKAPEWVRPTQRCDTSERHIRPAAVGC